MLSLIPAGIYTCDAEGRITFYNHRAAELWGREPQLNDSQERFCACYKVFLPDGTFVPPERTPMAIAVREGKSFQNVEAVVERPDGSRFYASVSIEVLRDEDGRITGAVNVFQDVTHHKEADEALRAELEDSKLLQKLSAELLVEQDIEALYEKLADAAMTIMRSDFASMQMLHPERGKGGALHLLSSPGFSPEARKFWEWVHLDSTSTCGEALRSGQRVIAPDVDKCDCVAGTEDLAMYRQTGIRATQTTPLLSRSGKLVGMISTHWRKPHEPAARDLRRLDILARQAADLIERRRNEEVLRESEERFRSVIDNSATIIYVKDCDGKYLLINKRCAAVFKMILETIGGKTDLDMFPLEIAQKYRENDLEVIRTGKPLEIEEAALLDDGLHTYISVKFPLRRSDGTIYAVAGVSTDITDRKRAQAADRLLGAIVESSDDAILSKDLNGIIQNWNQGAERIFGYTAEEVIGKPVTILMPPERMNEEPGILERIRRGERIDHYETVRRRKDGALIDISLTVSPIKDANGKVIGASKVARDITERVRAKEKLEQTVAERTASLREAVAQMEEFSYTVSHDLRAPLRAMQVYSETLLEDFAAALPEEARHHLNRIAHNARLLDKMVFDVLTFSRMARAEQRLEKVSLQTLARRIVEQYPGLQAPQAEIQIEPLPDVLGHEPSLTQALSNLLNNAIKFVAPGVRPKVRVWSERKDGRVRVWIADNGIGIDPKYQHRLFNMFERIHLTLNYEGTGVGLAIVRKAVERMGGSVGMESDGKSGSRFWFELGAAPE